MYPLLFRIVLSRLDAEFAHHCGMLVVRVLGLPPLSWATRALTRPAPELQTRALGLTFDSPFGVAAGFDKNVVGVAFPYSRFWIVVAAWLLVGLVIILATPGLAARIGTSLAADEGLAPEPEAE